MRRTVVPALVFVGSLVLAGTPASAKPGEGPQPPQEASVFVSGPGLDVPIVLDGRAALRVLYLTTFRAFGQYEPVPPAAASLGPRYEAWYFAPASDGQVRMIRQDLYPCADGAVWAHTPTEQGPFERSLFPVQVSTGWWYSTAFVGTTRTWDLPCEARRVSAVGAVRSGDGGGPIWFAWLLLVVAIVVISVGRILRYGALRSGTELGR
jgi:hypothetical protein